MRWGWVELRVVVQHPDIFLGKPFSIYRRLSLYITGIQKIMNLYKQAQITRYLSDVFEEAHMYLLGICSIKRLQILISFSLYIKNSRKMYQKKIVWVFYFGCPYCSNVTKIYLDTALDMYLLNFLCLLNFKFIYTFIKNQNWEYLWISSLKCYEVYIYCMSKLRPTKIY